jgi:2-haloacid dehalogenase
LKNAIFRNFENVMEGMPGLLHELAQQGYDLILESNHLPTWIEHILEIHPFLLTTFPQRSFSFETGRLNQDDGALAAIASRFGKTPSECVYISNSRNSVSVARASGMNAIHFTDAASLRQDLTNMHVL